MSRDFKNIGLLNHVGYGNLGDDATLDSVIQNIKRRWPHAAIVGLSLNPYDTEHRHGIPSYAIRRETKSSPSAHVWTNSKKALKARLKPVLAKYRLLFITLQAAITVTVRKPRALLRELSFLAESFRVVRSLNLLVICGGGQLLDSWGGPWCFPYTIFKWILLAKLVRKKCYFINVGAGPLDHPLSKWFVKHALSLGDYASFRDAKSRALVHAIGFSGRTEVLADCVYGLETPATKAGRRGPAETPIVGISPMAYCDPRRYWDKNQAVYDAFIAKLALFTARLAEIGHRLMFLSSDIWFDSDAIDDVTGALNKNRNGHSQHRIMRPPISDAEELMFQMSRLDYIVTCRFHGVVFAHLMKIPVVALSHHPKVVTLMSDLGLSEYCVDIRTFDPDLLMKTFVSLAATRDDVKARMAEKAADFKRRLAVQFDALFPKTIGCGI